MTQTTNKTSSKDMQGIDPDQFPNTRLSLISRVRRKDSAGWNEFVSIYGRVIYNVAIRKGLKNAAAEDVVQETYLAVMKGIQIYQHRPVASSFRRWLRTIVKYKIFDQYRKRIPVVARRYDDARTRATATIDRVEDLAASPLDALWDAEWAKTLMAAATERVKKQASTEQYQIYDLYVIKEWPVKKIIESLGVSQSAVYLAKHRVNVLFKKSIKEVEKSLWLPKKSKE